MSGQIITIGRQFGSGGREIGETIARKLDIPCYDRELITMAAQQSGISEEVFEKADEKHRIRSCTHCFRRRSRCPCDRRR